ncbi:MAG: DeoR family transcriptional regulator, fructose operon transcriptional repressor [Chloroflexota bacterium]|nr:DeoR family transcriptional regulator, fructose operon transcriptional repressor [Chloroflexota bacterium]
MDQKSRLSYIVDRIEKRGSVSISELAESFGVSEMTVRRDLIELEKMSIVRRVHGGAVSFYGRSFEPPLISRSNKNVAAKQRIGKYAASMVLDGDSIAIDVGSTTIEMAMNLVGRQNLTILTPSLHIANLMSEEKNIRLILSGGIVRQGEKSLIGDLAYLAFREIFVDRLFLGVGGIDAQVGLTEFEMQDAQVKKEMIKSAKEVIVLADSSKFQQVAFSFFARLDQIDHIVSDKEPPQPLLDELIKNNVEIHVVSE